MVRITGVSARSRAHSAGLGTGDILVSINGHDISDVLDYRFYLTEKTLDIVYLRDGKKHAVTLKKDMYDDIGLDFETPLMDKKHSCENKCIFCFIDQNPPGMRESIYFKDDDSRLSFLHGNYITLTNLRDHDIERIIEMHMSPVNVSVHTTNPELRRMMMHNKRAGEVLGDPPGVLLAVGGVDHDEVGLVGALVDDEVVHHAALLVAHGAVAGLAAGHHGVVVGQQMVQVL